MGMMKSNTIDAACTYCILLAMAWGLSAAPLSAAEEILNLGDFVWAVGNTRSEATVKREIPACVGFTEGKDEEFKSEQYSFSIVSLTLKAKKAGRLALVPELFLVRDGGLHGVYRVCQGIRVVAPKPNPRVAAFHPPSDASQWPGHAGRIACKAGDPVVVELLFEQIVREDAEILAASPAATLQRIETHEMRNRAIDSDNE
jgi:hypothetical protein